jgi:hypothetical protein
MPLMLNPNNRRLIVHRIFLKLPRANWDPVTS